MATTVLVQSREVFTFVLPDGRKLENFKFIDQWCGLKRFDNPEGQVIIATADVSPLRSQFNKVLDAVAEDDEPYQIVMGSPDILDKLES